MPGRARCGSPGRRWVLAGRAGPQVPGAARRRRRRSGNRTSCRAAPPARAQQPAGTQRGSPPAPRVRAPVAVWRCRRSRARPARAPGRSGKAGPPAAACAGSTCPDRARARPAVLRVRGLARRPRARGCQARRRSPVDSRRHPSAVVARALLASAVLLDEGPAGRGELDRRGVDQCVRDARDDHQPTVRQTSRHLLRPGFAADRVELASHHEGGRQDAGELVFQPVSQREMERGACAGSPPCGSQNWRAVSARVD